MDNPAFTDVPIPDFQQGQDGEPQQLSDPGKRLDRTDAHNVNGYSKCRRFFIALGSFVLYFCSWGLAQGFGVMFIALKDEYESTKSETTWVSSLFSGVLLVTGPVSGVFLQLYGCRRVGVVGSLLLVSGLVASVFTPSLQVLYITYGVIGGLGGSLLFTTAGVVVLQSFHKYRSLVIGFSESGAALGTLLIPIITDVGLDKYGFRGTFLILAGVALQCLVVSLLFPAHQTADTPSNNNVLKPSVPKSKVASLQSMFGFFNLGYVAFALSWALFMLPFLIPFIFLPDAGMASGLSQRQAAYIAAALGVGSVVGKFSFGFLGDIKRLETTLMHIIPIMFFGALSLLYTMVSSFGSFMALAALFGLVSAIADGIHPVITYQLVGSEYLSVGLGMLYFLMSITTILGAPLAGWIADTFDGYTEAFYYCAGCSFLAAFVALYIPCWKRRHIKTSQGEETIVQISK